MYVSCYNYIETDVQQAACDRRHMGKDSARDVRDKPFERTRTQIPQNGNKVRYANKWWRSSIKKDNVSIQSVARLPKAGWIFNTFFKIHRHFGPESELLTRLK